MNRRQRLASIVTNDALQRTTGFGSLPKVRNLAMSAQATWLTAPVATVEVSAAFADAMYFQLA